MKKIALFCLILFPYLAVAQQFITGKVSANKEPVPYALVVHNKSLFGICANEKGDFSLTILEKYLKDSLVVSCVGFETTTIPIKEIYQKSFIEISLKENIQELGIVVVRPPNTKITRLGSKKDTNTPTIGVVCRIDSCDSEIQKGLYFAKPTKKIDYYINKVSYYIGGVGVPKTPFRVRIYRYDDQKQQPSEDLLSESVVVVAAEKGWFEVDLQKYNLIMPDNGVVVAMEWLLTNERKYFYTPSYLIREDIEKIAQSNKTGFGQTVGMYEDRKQTSFWFFRLNNKVIWYKQTDSHPMIRLYLESQ